MRAVNLLPREEATGGNRRMPVPVIAGCVGAVVVTAILALMYLSASSKVGAQRTALQQVQAQFNAIPGPPAASPVSTQLPSDEKARVTALSAALGQRVAWDRVMREMAQVVPSDVWLVQVAAKSPTIQPPTPGGGTAAQLPLGFVLNGCTYSQDAVGVFLARLQLVPDLTNMTLGSSSNDASASGGTTNCPTNMYSFALQGDVKVGGATS